MKIEIILIVEKRKNNKFVRAELQIYRNNNRVGPFIRLNKDGVELESSLIENHKKFAFLLRLCSSFLKFPIHISDKYCHFFLSIAITHKVKIYEKNGISSSIKKSDLIYNHDNELKNMDLKKLSEIYFYITTKGYSFYITPFFKDLNHSGLIPLHSDFFSSYCEFYSYLQDEILINCILNNINSVVWRLSVIELIDLQSLSNKSDIKFHFLIEKKVKKINSNSAKNSYEIKWLENSTENILEYLNDDITSVYLKNREYAELTQVIKGQYENEIVEKNIKFTEFYQGKNTINSTRRIYFDISKQSISERLIEVGLNGELKEYQLDGVLWLLERFVKNEPGVLLSDEMGLGKTLQALSFLMLIYAVDKSYLIICPASVKYNWYSEILKFFPVLSNGTIIFNSSDSKNKYLNKIVIMSYEQARVGSNHYNNYDFIILDESQKIKNKKTLLWAKINEIECGFRILLTGTPIENSENDLLSNLNFIYSGDWPMSWRIIESNKAFGLLSRTEKVKVIKTFFSDIILSRRKLGNINLPDCNRDKVYIDMEPAMKVAYEYTSKMFLDILSINRGQYNFVMLDALLKLRQLCAMPKLLNGVIPDNLSNFECKKFIITKDKIISNIKEAKKTIIFCTFLNVLREFEFFLNDINCNYVRISGETTAINRSRGIDKFQSHDSCLVFLSTMHVGGIGVNLTSASEVIIYNSWWNPAIEEQAIARAHRIGQNNDVNVFIPIYRGTIEEKINILLDKKRELNDAFNNISLTLDDYIFLLGD